MPRFSPALLMVAAFLLCAASPSRGGETARSATPRYPPSAVIAGIDWDFEHLVRQAPGSDLWPVTWADDDALYVSWGDGGGFGGTNSLGRVSLGFARIEGGPERFQATNIWGGQGARHKAAFGGKTAGLVAVSGVLYAWINMQDADPPHVRLAWSADHARSWHLADWSFPEDHFFPATFLNFGKNYAGARDGFVYVYGGPWEVARDHFLARVPRGSLEDRNRYEFFAGTSPSGQSFWTGNIRDRKPVLTDPSGIRNIVSVVHLPALGRYLALTSHGMQVGQLAVYDAPAPWGPWTTVAYEENWGGFGRGEALCYSVPTKWLSADNKTLWCIFSSTGVLDSFNLVKGTLRVRRP